MKVDYESSAPMVVSATLAEASTVSSPNIQAVPPPMIATKKKRNLPGMPHPDAEVISLSPKTLLATNRFVCEVCNKGFQRDQNLQLHRRGHNLPWKLKQRTSKEVRKRVYVCPEPSCVHHDPSRALGDLTGIKKHFCRKHGEKKWKCERCSKKYAVQSDWKAHMKTCGTREYRCDCGTLFSRRDSFITHRAFCDALAQESARNQTLAITNSEGTLTVQAVTTTSSSSPPPPPLTPSTGVLSPVLSIQSSELPENQTGLLPQQPVTTSLSAAAAAATAGGTSTTSGGNVSSTTGVFAGIFSSPTEGGGLTQPSQQPPSPYSDLLCAMAGSERTTMEPMSLSLSSSFYLSNNGSSIFPRTDQDHHRHYAPSSQPALSATALLQKAAQMGSTASNSSFLRGLGLAIPPSSDHQDRNSATTTTKQWNGHARRDGNPVASGFCLGLPSEGPTTLDLLGLGPGGSGASTGGLSALLHSMGNSLDIAAGASFGGVNPGRENWEGPSERKPTLL
ncbi:unnamed protein product [Ilex paraguariensis]|uniref:C2H2-type domain-containing protein n=1 Tax=Ilex paraguariensis TaxID=185542 RepID=A0ABC8UA31_9AQUA